MDTVDVQPAAFSFTSSDSPLDHDQPQDASETSQQVEPVAEQAHPVDTVQDAVNPPKDPQPASSADRALPELPLSSSRTDEEPQAESTEAESAEPPLPDTVTPLTVFDMDNVPVAAPLSALSDAAVDHHHTPDASELNPESVPSTDHASPELQLELQPEQELQTESTQTSLSSLATPTSGMPHLEVPESQHSPDSSSSSMNSPHPSQVSDSLEQPVASSSTAPSSTRTSLTDTHSQSCSTQPTGILRSPTGSVNSSPVVTFAPLPQTDQRKRNSHVPLGVAARSRMLRQRRLMRVGDADDAAAMPEGGQRANLASLTLEQMRQLEAIQAEQAHQRAGAGAAGITAAVGSRPPNTPYAPMWQGPPEDDDTMPEEDALLQLGRMVKGGARTLWRRVSHSQLKERAKSPTGKENSADQPIVPREKMHGLRRSLSEPRQSTGASESLTVSVLVKEPAHLFDEREEEKPKSPKSAGAGSRPGEVEVEAVKVTEHMHGGIVQEDEEEEQGRVWEEVVDSELTRRMEELARAKAKERKGSGLVEKLACLSGIRVKKTTKPR